MSRPTRPDHAPRHDEGAQPQGGEDGVLGEMREFPDAGVHGTELER